MFHCFFYVSVVFPSKLGKNCSNMEISPRAVSLPDTPFSLNSVSGWNFSPLEVLGMQPAALSPVGFFGLVGRISRSHIQEQGHPSIAFFHLESHVKSFGKSGNGTRSTGVAVVILSESLAGQRRCFPQNSTKSLWKASLSHPRSVRCLWIIASRDKMKLSADLHRFLPASSAVWYNNPVAKPVV